jgi:hypothetical protein
MDKKVVEFTLPDSGVVVRIKRIGPPLANDIRRKLKKTLAKPEPPLQEVMLGDEKKMVPNLSHPDYQEAVSEYTADMGMLFLGELIRYGVDADIDTAAVEALRNGDEDNTLPKSDLVVYVTRVAIESTKDMLALQDAILGRFQPTEAAVSEAAENFPGPVPGA